MLSNFSTLKPYLLAGNPEASAIVLDQLSLSTNALVRARVAENQNTSLGTLLHLMNDESPEVRRSITFNPRRRAALLQQLANDRHVDVRYAVAEDPMTPAVILRKLSADDNPYVAHRAQRTLSRVELLDQQFQAA